MLGFGLEGAGWAQVAAVPGGVNGPSQVRSPNVGQRGRFGAIGGLGQKNGHRQQTLYQDASVPAAVLGQFFWRST